MTRRRPVLKCRQQQVLCPDPTCRAVQRGLVGTFTSPHKFRGRGISQCSCGVEYFFHSADGVVEVVGLWPGEAARIDIDAALYQTLEILGLMAVA